MTCVHIFIQAFADSADPEELAQDLTQYAIFHMLMYKYDSVQVQNWYVTFIGV